MHQGNPTEAGKPAEAIELVPGNSLITETPEQGRQLAVKLSRLIMKLTQPDAAVRERQTIAMEFATIAAANNYWTKEKPSR